MNNHSQQSSRESSRDNNAESRTSSRASSSQNSATSTTSAPSSQAEQYPLCSVPRYMSTPNPISQYEPLSGVGDRQMSLDPSAQSQLDTEARNQQPTSRPQRPQTPEQSSPTDTQGREATDQANQSRVSEAPAGGVYDEERQQCLPESEQAEGRSAESSTSDGEHTEPPSSGETEKQEKKAPLPDIILARTGTIRAPRIPSPPPAALKRRNEIQLQTGDTPEMHHAKIQVAVLRVVDAARDGQRQIVWRVGNLARDTHKSFDDIARDILGFVGGCIAQVQTAVSEAKGTLTSAVDGVLVHMNEMGTVEDSFLQTSRTEAEARMMDQLIEPGSELERVHLDLQAEFSPYLETAKTNIRNIDSTGSAVPVAPPADAEISSDTPAEQLQSPVPQKTLLNIKQELEGELEQRRNNNPLQAWYAHRIDPVLSANYTRRHPELTADLDTQAESLDSYTFAFSRAAMSLSAPMAASFRERQNDAESQIAVDNSDDRHNLAITLGQHGETLIHKFDGVIAYLDEDLQPKLIEGLQKAGHQAAEAFRDQGKTSERMMNNTAATLAEAYPQLIMRVAEMLPNGQFLNEGELGPRLKSARESSRRLPNQQYAQMQEQAETTLAQARESAKTQMANLGETAEKGVQQVNDTMVAARFDFETFGFQVTGVLRMGSEAAVTGARDYALRMAEQILSTRGEEDSRLTSLLANFVVNLNSHISDAGNNYFNAVDQFKTRMSDDSKECLFSQVEKECDDILDPKAQDLDEDLTAPDDDVTTGLVVLNVATLGMSTGLTVGYLAYSDADDDEIFATLGDLRWPSQPALKYYFESAQNANKGNLFNRFDECLSSEASRRAKGLFSANHTERFNARRDSIRNSLSINPFTSLDADARRSLTQGIDEKERSAAGDDAIDNLIAEINDSWSAFFQRDTQRRMDEGYLSGDMGMVLSARMEQDMATARSKSDDEIFQSVQRIEQMAREELKRGQSSLAIDHQAIQNLTDQAMQDFAERRRPEGQQGPISIEDARQSYLNYALADRIVAHGEQVQQVQQVQQVPVDQQVQDYANAVINGGWHENDEALAAQQSYEFSRAEHDAAFGGPSETATNRLTQAFSDPELANLERELREHPDKADELGPEIARLRQQHEERMARVAKRLDPTLTDEGLALAGGAVEYMAQRTARMFSGGENYHTGRSSSERTSFAQEDAQYGYELISEGRVSLTAGIRMATRGGGTNEDLLRMTFQNRSKEEVAQTRTDWQQRYGENLDEYLGIQHRSPEEELRIRNDPVYGWLQGGEVSGDLANDIQILARGNPETDQDHIELAVLRYQQQRRRGTGNLALLTMSGTDEAGTIDSHYADMGQTLLDEARDRRRRRMQDPNYESSKLPLPTDPTQVFTHDGRINPQIAGLVFTPGPARDGKESPPIFSGDRAHIFTRARQVELAGDRYKSELDRQESLMLAGITALAIAATVILCAFGVGFVLASMIVALGSGLMTMTVKSGMRGERYGWEEAAVDAASTAIEVAAAGAGGALGKGASAAASGGTVAGILPRAGAALQNTFGRFGGMVARESIVGAVSTAANTALQDETYKDGPGAAFGRILVGGVKGASISAVSAGVSDGMGGRLNKGLVGGLDDLSDTSSLARLGRALGPNGAKMAREGIAEGLGGFAGEAAGIVVELASGTYKGNLQDALKRMGQAGLKDMVSAAGRTGAQTIPRRQYNALMVAARRSGNLSDTDINALRTAAKAAGEDPPSATQMRAQIASDQALLLQLPPSVRRHAESMDSRVLQQMVGLLQSGKLAGPGEHRHKLLSDLIDANPEIDPSALVKSLEASSQNLKPADTGDVDAQRAVREKITGQLPNAVRSALNDIPLQGLQHVPQAELPRFAEAMTNGRLKGDDVDALLRAAHKANPDLDTVTFLKDLNSAVQSSHLAQQAHKRVLQKHRNSVLADVSDADARLFSQLGDSEIDILRTAMAEGALPPQRLHQLFDAALKIDPSLNRGDFETSVKQALSKAKKRQQSEALAQRQQREQIMENVPEALRDILSVLPGSALLQLRILQIQGELSPAARQKLIAQARAQDPKLDIAQFNRALDQTLAQGKPITHDADQSQQLRNELKALAPAGQKHLLDDVPIVHMSDSEFKHYAKSQTGNAVTVIINGKPVVILREGADPKVLREEGIHALQVKDPRWAKQIGALDENDLQRWDDLPVDMQVALYRNKLELEINAHDHMIDALGERLRLSSDPNEQKQLRLELELAQQTQLNLSKRMAEVNQLTPLAQLQMQAGLLPKPQYLDQPARMFNKVDLTAAVTQTGVRSTKVKYENLIDEGLTDADATRLLSLALNEGEMRKVLNTLSEVSKRSRSQTIKNISAIKTQLGDGIDVATISRLLNQKESGLIISELRKAIRQTIDTKLAATMANMVANLAKDQLFIATRLNNFMKAADRKSAIESLGRAGLRARSLMKLFSSDDPVRVINQRIFDLAELKNNLPPRHRNDIIDSLIRRDHFEQVLSPLMKTSRLFDDPDAVKLVTEAIIIQRTDGNDPVRASVSGEELYTVLKACTSVQIAQIVSSGLNAYHLNKVLRSSLGTTDKAQRLNELASISASLHLDDRKLAIDRLINLPDYHNLTPHLNQLAQHMQDPQKLNQLISTIATQERSRSTVLEAIVLFAPTSSQQQLKQLAQTLIDAPADRRITASEQIATIAASTHASKVLGLLQRLSTGTDFVANVKHLADCHKMFDDDLMFLALETISQRPADAEILLDKMAFLANNLSLFHRQLITQSGMDAVLLLKVADFAADDNRLLSSVTNLADTLGRIDASNRATEIAQLIANPDFDRALESFIITHLGKTRSRDELLIDGAIPSLRDGFSQWFDSLSLAELRIITADNKLYDAIADRIRNGGAKHEWLMVCEMERIKSWGVPMEEVHRFTSINLKLEWTIPANLDHPFAGKPGAHTELVGGEQQTGRGSGTLHRELRAIIQSSKNIGEFNAELVKLLKRWQINTSLLPAQFPKANTT